MEVFFMKSILINFVFFLCLVSCGCENLSGMTGHGNLENGITVASWNVQTFFDGEKDGNEYSDFLSSKNGWSKAKYLERVKKLCEIIVLLDCDVVVFQEVEKETLAYDITNNLSFQVDRRKAYNYSVFAKEEDDAIGNMVLSRFPLGEMEVHQIKVEDELLGKQPDLRPMMEIPVYISKNPEENQFFTLFLCHWKSKSGGKEESETWRNYQEELLADRILENGDGRFLACGDFNRDLEDFAFSEDEKMVFFRGRKDNVFVFSPWNKAENVGSYYYEGEWEKIDHFFSGENLEILSFAVENRGPHVSEEGMPYRYEIYSGLGYSDHLPIRCRIKLSF